MNAQTSTRRMLRMLAWEFWHRSRGMQLAVIGTIPVCALLFRLLQSRIRGSDLLQTFAVFPFVVSGLLVFAACNNTEHNPARQWRGFPYRSFVLPMPTWQLVAWPMVLSVGLLLAVCVAWSQLIYAPLGLHLSAWVILVLATQMVSFLAILWSLAAYTLLAIAVLSLSAICLLTVGLLPMLLDSPGAKSPLGALLLGVMALAYLIAWRAVDRQRHGGGRGGGWTRQIRELWCRLGPHRRREFTNPMAAQFWYEWRRSGWVLPLAVTGVLLAIFLPVAWVQRKDAQATIWISGWLFALPLLLAMVIGRGFGTPDFWSGKLTVPPFQAVRPLAAGDWVVTKLRVAALSTVAAWLAVVAFAALWLNGWANTAQLQELWDVGLVLQGRGTSQLVLLLLIAAGMLLTWRGFAATLSSGLTGSRAFALLSVFAQVFLLALAGLAAVWLENLGKLHLLRLDALVVWTGVGLGLAVVGKFALAVYTWRRITPARAGRYALLWAGGTLMLLALVWLACPPIPWLQRRLFLAALLPLPLARVALAPAAFARNRHR